MYVALIFIVKTFSVALRMFSIVISIVFYFSNLFQWKDLKKFNIEHYDRCLTLHVTLPSIRFSGTTPKTLESIDCAGLSPSNQT